MAVGSRTKTRGEIGIPHKQDDLAECTHVERRHDEMVVASNEDPQVNPRNFDHIEKKLVRKLDWVILPVLWIMYWLK